MSRRKKRKKSKEIKFRKLTCRECKKTNFFQPDLEWIKKIEKYCCFQCAKDGVQPEYNSKVKEDEICTKCGYLVNMNVPGFHLTISSKKKALFQQNAVLCEFCQLWYHYECLRKDHNSSTKSFRTIESFKSEIEKEEFACVDCKKNGKKIQKKVSEIKEPEDDYEEEDDEEDHEKVDEEVVKVVRGSKNRKRKRNNLHVRKHKEERIRKSRKLNKMNNSKSKMEKEGRRKRMEKLERIRKERVMIKREKIERMKHEEIEQKKNEIERKIKEREEMKRHKRERREKRERKKKEKEEKIQKKREEELSEIEENKKREEMERIRKEKEAIKECQRRIKEEELQEKLEKEREGRRLENSGLQNSLKMIKTNKTMINPPFIHRSRVLNDSIVFTRSRLVQLLLRDEGYGLKLNKMLGVLNCMRIMMFEKEGKEDVDIKDTSDENSNDVD